MLARSDESVSKSNAAVKEDRVLMWANVIDIISFIFLCSWYNNAKKKQPIVSGAHEAQCECCALLHQKKMNGTED